MKALLYKEFKLAMHPICYIFVIAFPLMVLIPSYPIAIGFIYVLTCYPILFLGANKGQQSNDLLYSTLLPVRKKDIVMARMLTVIILQFAFIILMACLSPLAKLIQDSIASSSGDKPTPGLTIDGFVSVVAIALVGYAIADLIFFPIYYKNGKSIVMSTLLTILGFILYLSITTIAIPYIPGGDGYVNLLCNSGIGIQFAFLGGALVIYLAIHILVYIISSKNLELVDF
ncbi:MAG: ABC-2 transporter permease [Bacilli bacterium]|nr:ABC-2 transporter permease [Bacilli bacterium]